MSPKECVQYYEETGITYYYADFPFARDAKIVVDEYGDYHFEAEDNTRRPPEDFAWYPF